jgi:hypothetical protein
MPMLRQGNLWRLIDEPIRIELGMGMHLACPAARNVDPPYCLT